MPLMSQYKFDKNGGIVIRPPKEDKEKDNKEKKNGISDKRQQ